MQNSTKLPLALLISIFTLAACGQKGPLFLPGDPSTIQTNVPAVPRSEPPGEELQDDESEDKDEDNQ